ncbi:MAG: DUF481 domain-containing protein [Pseudomonadota bacterium]
MKFNRLLVIGAVAAGWSVQVAAQDEELGWSGKGGLGIVSQRGNADTETINITGELVNNMNQWRHLLGLAILNSSENGEDTANRFEVYGQSDYKISETSYWFGSLRYEDDDFSQFENQATLAAGYGRELFNNDVHKLNGEIGLGYRRAELRGTGETATDPILRGKLGYEWVLSDNATLSNNLLVEAGSDNTFAKNVTALTADIASNFGLQVAYEIRHNTDVDDPANNSDFVTTVNLVYSLD